MKKRLLLAAFIIAAAMIILNWPLTYRVGVDGVVSEKKIPLYAKACGFLYRDWMYKDIVRSIVNDKMSDEEKALAIMRWTTENIKGKVPVGLKTVDDHPLNIIIRQYGQEDQLEDVFTILCSYTGVYGGMYKCYNDDKSKFIILSFVNTKTGQWLIFDVSKNKYFLNDKGGVASVSDYLEGKIILSDEDKAMYGDYFDDIRNIDFSSMTRASEQMPIRRVMVEMRKIFGKK
ncbi:MAG: hypothetical protein NC938_02960 [Candidatus Omnitrophica bacterium]|nr:hypothetical protein [Candidatus Omnitrophota bacterium]